MKLSIALLLLLSAGCAFEDGGEQESGSTMPYADAALVPDAGSVTDAGSANDAGVPAPFSMRVVTTGLFAPWEVTYGPDRYLWVTERVGRRVVRINPLDGSRHPALQVEDAHQSAGQDGVIGLALHPELLQGQSSDFVYLAYIYDADPGVALQRRARIVRYAYDPPTQSLGRPVELIGGLPASNDHNAGRLVFGGDGKLYYTIGDGGANQFGNKCNPIRAQELPTAQQVATRDWQTYQGKTLRLEPDGSIPADNPVIEGVRSHIFTYGHRNPQGIVFGANGLVYASEQGPKTDDEVNHLVGGGNYGWPYIAGYQDDQAYVYGNWSASSPTPCEALEFSDYVLPDSVPRYPESSFELPDFVPPLATFYTVADDFDFTDPACAGAEFICWPTIAPASIDFYEPGADGVPGWGRALLVPSLKEGTVFRATLTADGKTIAGAAVPEWKTTNRYRDVAIAPDRRTFYVITDNEGLTSGPEGGFTGELEHRGAVLELTYTGPEAAP